MLVDLAANGLNYSMETDGRKERERERERKKEKRKREREREREERVEETVSDGAEEEGRNWYDAEGKEGRGRTYSYTYVCIGKIG